MSAVMSALVQSGARVPLMMGAAAIPVAVLGLANNMAPVVAGAGIVLAAAFGLGTIPSLNQLKRGTAKTPCNVALTELVENMRDALLRFDKSGEITLATESVTKLLSCRRFDLTADGLAERVHILDRPLYHTAFSEAHKDGKTRTIEVRLRSDADEGAAAPKFFWAEIFFAPNIPSGQGTGPFVLTVTLRDVTEARKVKAQMDEARRAAEEASLAKNRFLAVIGHELRTPLNAIVGFSDMMANGIGGKLDPAHEEYVSLISQSGHHLLEMVNMLLDMSKIEAGGFELQAEFFEPEKLVAPCVQMVTKTAAEKSVDLNVTLGNHLPEIRADERACRQILLNLLSNAVKFTETGGQVTWSMKQRGKYIVMRVTDTGIGMSEDVLSRLGEPFYQAQNSIDRGYEGTGLGMSIVKGLVDLHQGKLDIKSALGTGTTVEVSLPINGPETNIGDDDTVTPLHDKDTQHSGGRAAIENFKRTA